MELLNTSGFAAAYTMGMDKSGRESLVVVAKGTFSLPLGDEEPELLAQQPPLVEADVFSGEPGFSAALYESEFAPHKPRCDVLLNGSAYAPTGQSATSVLVGLKLLSSQGVAIEKVFEVVGDRYWYTGMGYGSTPAEPFTKQVISYDVAFGGTDDFHPDENKRNAFMRNTVGRGYHHYLDSELLDNTPLPNTQERGKSISSPAGDYVPMSYGVISRSSTDRVKHAGTYDQEWIDNTFPFLPSDFDERYFQSAPLDQQCDFLKGGEIVQLLNLTPSGRAVFKIPTVEVPVVFFKKRGEDLITHAVADTLLIEPDKGVFSMVWRVHLPLKKNMFEVTEVLLGTKSRGWWRARATGKKYFPSLAHIGKETDD